MNETEVIALMLTSPEPVLLIKRADMIKYKADYGSELMYQTGGYGVYRQNWTDYEFIISAELFRNYGASMIIFEGENNKYHELGYNNRIEGKEQVTIRIKIYIWSFMNRAELIAMILTSPNKIDVIEFDKIVMVLSSQVIAAMNTNVLWRYEILLNISPIKYALSHFYLEINPDLFILGSITSSSSVEYGNFNKEYRITFISYEMVK